MCDETLYTRYLENRALVLGHLVVKDLSTESLTCVLILLDGKPHLFV